MVPYIIMATLVGLYSHDWSSYPAQGWACIAMACKRKDDPPPQD